MGYYVGRQPSVSASDTKKRSKVMKNNVALSRQLTYSPSLRMDTLVRGPMSPEMERKRRESIHYQFEYIYGSPSQDEWKETGVVLGIMRALLIPDNSRTSVEKILRDIIQCASADLKNSMNYNVTLSTGYAVGDPRRMLLGTPAQVWDTMVKCWSLEPTSDRIIEDIDAFPRVLEKIIANSGCAVKDEAIRSGRRALKSNNQGELKNKIKTRQRKDSIVGRPVHPQCEEAWNILLGKGQEHLQKLEAESVLVNSDSEDEFP